MGGKAAIFGVIGCGADRTARKESFGEDPSSPERDLLTMGSRCTKQEELVG